MHYLYLVRPKEFCQKDVNIYKIGKTKQNKVYNRLSQYNTNSDLILAIPVIDVDFLETTIKIIFNKIFTIYKGTEYFQGDVELMISIIIDQVHLEKSKYTLENYCHELKNTKNINPSDTRIYSDQLPIKLNELEFFINEIEYKLSQIDNEIYRDSVTSLSILLFLSKNYYYYIKNMAIYNDHTHIINTYDKDDKIKSFLFVLNKTLLIHIKDIKKLFLKEQSKLYNDLDCQINSIIKNYTNSH